MWIVPPSIQSAFAQASGCLTKDFTPDLNSWASEAERSCSLSGKLSPSASWLRAWKKDHWLQRLSGLAISPNSQQDDFAAWWMASSLDSHVKTCPSPAVVRDLTASDPVFSSTYSTSQTIAMRGSSFWRTSRASLLPPPPLWTKKKASSKNAPLPASWENWPTVGGMRNGSLFQRPMWVPATGAPDGSASPGEKWQTPKASEEESGSGMNSRGEPKLKAQANNWMTPHGMGGMDSTGKLGAGGEFAKQATCWMTPRATDGTNGGPNQRGSKGDLMLPSMAAQWPTPNSLQASNDTSLQCSGDGRENPNKLGWAVAEFSAQWPTPMASDDGKKVVKDSNQAGLIGAAHYWPTPAARDFRSEQGGVKTMDHFNRPAGPSLPAFIAHSPFSPQGQPTQDGLDYSPDSLGLPQPSQTKRLNPYFVEFLMGWRAGWTSPIVQPAYAQEEMALYRSALQVRLSSLFADPASSKEAA